MTGEEMLAEIERREVAPYYLRKDEREGEILDGLSLVAKLLFIAGCLLSIAGHIRELWQGL